MEHPRNPKLEDLVASRPDDREAHLVYADWLQSIGDPQGELIAISIAAEDEPKRARKLKMRAKKLLAAFIEDRCVPAFPTLQYRFRAWADERAYQPDKMFGSSAERISWRWGLIRSVAMNSWPPRYLAQGLALLQTPLAMFVDHVDVFNTSIDDLTPLAGLRCLRVLNLNRAENVTDLTPLANLRELRRVWFGQTGVTSLAPLLDLPALEAFECNEARVPADQLRTLRARLQPRDHHGARP